MNEIVMPKLSDTMTEGRLVSWKKRVGETVRRGEVLAEVETDKANMELESFTEGVLLETKAKPGDMVPVGTVIALIGKPEEKGAEKGAEAPSKGETAPQPEPQPQQPSQQARPEAQPQPQAQQAAGAQGAPPEEGARREGVSKEDLLAAAEQPGIPPQPPGEGVSGAGKKPPEGEQKGPGEEVRAPAPPEAGGGPERKPEPPQERGPAESTEAREKAAPVVRRRARELGIDLAQVHGSGPDGRILLHDLEGAEAGERGKEPAAPPREAGVPPKGAGAPPAKPQAPPGEEGVRPLPRLRAAIAKIVSESWRTIPHFTVTMEIMMDDAEAIHRQLKQNQTPVTVNDLIVKAVALALQKFPQVNSSFTPEGMRLHRDINIGVAVGVRDGVMVPVIQGCQGLSVFQISEATRRMAERARAGALSEQEMSGGTFAVSNLGMYGVNHFTAIIYPSHSGVLTVGAVAEKAMMRNGVLSFPKVMEVTLCADHRLIDGALAAEFLVELKRILENPVRLLL